jgi:hypothetical protein
VNKKARYIARRAFVISELEQIYFNKIIFFVVVEDPALSWKR